MGHLNNNLWVFFSEGVDDYHAGVFPNPGSDRFVPLGHSSCTFTLNNKNAKKKIAGSAQD